jgi:cytochrome c oxidase subunit III
MADVLAPERPLPVGARGRNSVGWWGMLCLIASEGALFAYVLFGYFYVAVQRGPGWSPEPHPTFRLAGPNTLVLLASSVAVWWGETGAKSGRRAQHLGGLGAGILLGALFLAIQILEWKAKPFGLNSGSYSSLYFVITGFHMAHVIAGLVMLTAIFGWSAMGLFTPRRHEPVSLGALYWHFVDAVWLAVFSTFYVSPCLMW